MAQGKNTLRGSSLVGQLKKKFKVTTDGQLASMLGNSVPGIQLWKSRQAATEKQVVGLVHSAHKAGADTLSAKAIRPVVEFYRIERFSKPAGAYELFRTKVEHSDDVHPYRHGLREELKKHRGVYLFFDSRGQAIYAGKTEAAAQNLWKEMNNAFNRDRGAVQKIKRVRHPERRQQYRTSDEKARQIVDRAVPLHELAAYFSAYEVADGLIGTLEAMLVRSFANDLLNVRMEQFNKPKRKRKSGAAGRRRRAHST